MKKWIALLLTLCLALACVPALAATPGEVVGEWFLQYRVYYNDIHIVMLGEYKVSLNRDASAQLVMNGSSADYTWSIDSSGDVDLQAADGSSSLYFDLTDGVLHTCTQDFSEEDANTYDFYFGREPVEVTLPTAAVAAQEDDFFGAWRAALQVENGGVIDIRDQNITAEIAFAQVALSLGGDPYIALTDYADGRISFNGSDVNIDEGKYCIGLTSDPDMLLVTMDGVDPMTASYYFERTGAAEQPAAPAQSGEVAEAPQQGGLDLPTPVAAEKEEDFYGSWLAVQQVEKGEMMDVSEYNTTAEVSFAQVTLNFMGKTSSALTNFIDGRLSLNAKELGYTPNDATFFAELTDQEGVALVTMQGVDPSVFAVVLKKQ